MVVIAGFGRSSCRSVGWVLWQTSQVCFLLHSCFLCPFFKHPKQILFSLTYAWRSCSPFDLNSVHLTRLWSGFPHIRQDRVLLFSSLGFSVCCIGCPELVVNTAADFFGFVFTSSVILIALIDEIGLFDILASL